MSTSDRDDMTTVVMACEEFMASTGIAPERLRELLALGWLTFGRLLIPVGGGGGGPVYAVVPASGDGAHLEQDVKGLLWLRGGELARFTIVIADGGLDGTGRAVAAALLARGQGIVLCPAERLGEYIKA